MTNPNVYPHQPEFIDNRDDNTLAAALIARVDHLCKTLATPPDLDVATGYFNPEGFGIVARTIEKLGHIRLLLGAEPIPPPARRFTTSAIRAARGSRASPHPRPLQRRPDR